MKRSLFILLIIGSLCLSHSPLLLEAKIPIWNSRVSAASRLAPLAPLAPQSYLKRQGYCERGGQRTQTNGSNSTTTVQQSIPSCTITVYDTGTTTLTSIYTDDAGATPKSNPLTADSTGFYFYYVVSGSRVDERYSGGTAPNNIATPWTRTDIALGGAISFSNQGVAVTPNRQKVDLPNPFLSAADDSSRSATALSSKRTPTGVYNAITDLGMSGDPRFYNTTVVIPAGATSVVLTGTTLESSLGYPDSTTDSIYPLKYRTSSGTHTFKVGQGIRIPRGGDNCCDYVGTVTAVSGNTITFAPATTTDSVDVTYVQHDDTAALNNFVNVYTSGTIQFPDGFCPVSSYHNYISGKDYAISIPLNAEATNQQWIFQGSGKFRSGLIHTGPGHLFKQGGVRTINPVWSGLYMAHASRYVNQALDITTSGVLAGSALYLQSNQSSGGVPQSDATGVRVDDCMILGWRDGIISDNLQSSKITNTSFYYNANAITLLGSNSVRGIGSQTEPNVNELSNLFIQYGQPLSGNLRTGSDTSTSSGSVTISCTGCAFAAGDQYKVISIPTAGVNGTTHFATITSIVSSTSAIISQPPWTSVSGQTATIYQTSRAHIFAQNASNLQIRGGTFQGSWVSPSNLANHGVWIMNSYSPVIDGLWIEDSGGTTGAAIRLESVYGARIVGSSFKADIPGGYANALKLDSCVGVNIDGSYIAESGTAEGIHIENTRGLKIDNTTLPGSYALYNVTNGAGNNNTPGELGSGVRSTADPGTISTENLYDSFSAPNLIVNGNFYNTFTGWTQDQASALTHVSSGVARFQKYVKIDYRTVGAPASGGTVLSQTYTIPDATQSYTPLSLAFDWRIEDRGADAIANSPRYNWLRVKLIYNSGATTQYEIEPSLTHGFATARWVRAQLQTLVPAGTSRSVQVIVESATGTNAGIFNIANFKLQYGKRVDYNYDSPISEIAGGRVQDPSKLLWPTFAGSGTRTICVDNAGLTTVGCAGGGGSGTVTSVGLVPGTTGSDVNVSGSPVTGAGSITLNIPDASATARGLIKSSGSQTLAPAFTLPSALQTAQISPITDDTSMLGTALKRFMAGHFATAGVVVHGDLIDTKKVQLTHTGTNAYLDAVGGTSNLYLVVGTTNGLVLDSAGVTTATGTGGINTSALTTGKVVIARGGTNADSASYSTNGAFYFDGTKYITTAAGGAGTLCLVSTDGGTPAWGACAGSSATALSAITAAGAANTINSADFAQIWKWTITTNSKVGFRISENTASAATTPVQFQVDTLATSTAIPVKFTAGGTANGVQLSVAGSLARIGTGSITANAVQLDNAGTGTFTLNYLANETLTASRNLTIKVNDAARTIDLGGNLTLAGALITSGANSLTFTTTGGTSVTLPTTGTLATLAGSETFTNKTLTSPVLNVGSDATGDIYYRNAGILTRLGIGSAGQILTVASGVPSWAAAGAASATTATFVSSNYTTLAPDRLTLMDASGGNRTVTYLAAASATAAFNTTCKIDTTANTVAVTIGSTTITLVAAGQCTSGASNGTSWYTFTIN